MNAPKYEIHRRNVNKIEINTDPQRRCYNGCHAKSEWVLQPWEVFDYAEDDAAAERKVKFWRELNDYAISQRGESARTEFKLVSVPDSRIENAKILP